MYGTAYGTARATLNINHPVGIPVGNIGLDRVIEFQNHGAQVVEVLSRKQFLEQHIPGAISLPLSKFKSSELAKLDKTRPVIVYCWDYQ